MTPEAEQRIMNSITPSQRRAWLLRPVTKGILAGNSVPGKTACGAGWGVGSGPRENVQGRLGGRVGFRRGTGIRS